MAPTSDDTTAPDERKHRIPKEEYQDIKSNLCEVKKFSAITRIRISHKYHNNFIRGLYNSNRKVSKFIGSV